MPSLFHILTVIGARPQFIKAAPLSRAFKDSGCFYERLLHTGQHFEHSMAGQFFEELGLALPEIDLGIAGTSHGDMTGRMLIGVEAELLSRRPDAVLVYGDTNSTLAGALAAAKLRIPVIHVEAGLRSRNRSMPEELNRILTDHVSDLLFCPTHSAVESLAGEGIVRGVHWVGDVMQDLVREVAADEQAARGHVEALGFVPGGYHLATIHRAENTDDPERFRTILEFINAETSGAPIALPLHPRIRDRADEIRALCPAVRILDPKGYLATQYLLAGSRSVLTDSGGLQKEAYFHRKPCITLRDETEWTETISAGWNRLWTVANYERRVEIADFGDGRAAARIASITRTFLAERRNS